MKKAKTDDNDTWKEIIAKMFTNHPFKTLMSLIIIAALYTFIFVGVSVRCKRDPKTGKLVKVKVRIGKGIKIPKAKRSKK